jgi:hypothetical protein
MADTRVLQLLHDCDQFLARQQELLDRAVATGCSRCTVVAMDAALDQLAAAVDSAWRLARPELTPGREAEESRPPSHNAGTEPGE